MNRYLTKGEMQMRNKHMKKNTTQGNAKLTAMRYNYTPITIAKT